MGVENRKRKAWLNFLTALLLCGALLILLLGTTFARYEAGKSAKLTMTYGTEAAQVYINEIETEETEDLAGAQDVYVKDLLLSNGTEEEHCSYDQIATLSLFMTVGAENPENFTITLTDGGINYEAVCQEVSEGTTMYEMHGPGWMYRFYNEAGEEVSWFLSGTESINRQMKITIEGTSTLPTALLFIASARPGNV